MTSIPLNIPDPSLLQHDMELLQEHAHGYDNGEVYLDVVKVTQDFYTVLEYEDYPEDDEKHAVFATQSEADAYYVKTLQDVEEYIEYSTEKIVEYRDLADDAENEILPGDSDPFQELDWEIPQLVAHKDFLTKVTSDGVQHHYGTIPLYTLTYPAWLEVHEKELQNLSVESLSRVETIRSHDFFHVLQKINTLHNTLGEFAMHAQNAFGYETFDDAYAHETYLQRLTPTYTVRQLYAARNAVFNYASLRKIFKKNRKSSDYTAEQINVMFENYRTIQGWVTRQVFETFLEEKYENMDWFLAAFDTEGLRNQTVQYIHDLIAPHNITAR